jgi:quinol-cytochrome oxidoreductase complex cytochrome b subunit
MISTTPGIGDALRTLLQGGPQLGNLTLTRFFTLHAFVLPGLMVFLIVVHLYLFRLHGVTTPWWESPARLQAQSEPFWPGQAWKDAVLAMAALIGLWLWCSHWPAPLGEQSDPARAYEARPEWYFMFLFQLLRYLKGPASRSHRLGSARDEFITACGGLGFVSGASTSFASGPHAATRLRATSWAAVRQFRTGSPNAVPKSTLPG